MPARPKAIRKASDALADLLPEDLPGPVLFLGMAETAITLGQSIYDRWRNLHNRSDCLYLHSTRQKLSSEPLIRFSEQHSHASAHLLYAPEVETLPFCLEDVTSLVLIDDEATTGRTFVNLVAQLASHLPNLERIEIALLTDWSDGNYLQNFPYLVASHALLEGTLEWESTTEPDLPEVLQSGALGQLIQHRNLGRVGHSTLEFDFSEICKQLSETGPQLMHVIGTGELHYPAMLIAECLEQAGHDVLLQATTRSPALIGGAINAKEVLVDNYGAGVPNYLYNAIETVARRRIVCHETGSHSLDPALVRPGDLIQAFGLSA